MLCDARPVRRILLTGNARFNLHRSGNLVAALVQVTGEEASPPCKQCSMGFGIFHECIKPRSRELQDRLVGSCANHFFNSQGTKCAFHFQNSSSLIEPQQNRRLKPKPKIKERIMEETREIKQLIDSIHITVGVIQDKYSRLFKELENIAAN
ncbi:hypothetical protein F5X99DRAFT_392099, partial [Biscogniauxia marginata]